MIQQTEHDLFILAVILIILAYFVGFATDATAVGAVASNLLTIGQGRNPQTGAFANYPSVGK